MERNYQDKRKFFMALTVAGIIVLLIIEAFIDVRSNVRAADSTSEVLLKEAESVLERNAEEEETLPASLKDDYITRAQAVAYILQNADSNAADTEELQRIAGMIAVDEICLFDRNGVIYASTNPEYIGVSMDDGEQISYFKQMLNDNKLTLC